MKVRHQLYCCVIASLCVIDWTIKPLPSLILEDLSYQKLMDEVICMRDLEGCLVRLGLANSPYNMIDNHCYLEEFFEGKLNERKRNFVNVTIDGMYHLVVQLKQI